MHELVDPTYALVLEMANGVGFVLMFELGITLLVIMLTRGTAGGWRLDTVTQLLLGMISIKAGLALGFGYRWLVARCRNVAPLECAHLEDDFWILWASLFSVAVGGLVILRVVSRPSWRPWSWLLALVISIVVPFFYYGFDLMFPVRPGWGEVVRGFYHWDRVFISVTIAVLGSYTALDVAALAIESSGGRKVLGIMAAGGLMGGSIWAMHFVAMLAFELPGVAVTYDPRLTLYSLLLPIGFTLVGFAAAASSGRPGAGSIVLSGMMVAAGVVGMHYLGMAAMEMSAVAASFDFTWVMVSVVIAIVGSIIAVWLVFVETSHLQRLGAAVVMGVFGISGLHYSAMVAFICRRVGEVGPVSARPVLVGLSQARLSTLVIVATFVILLAFLVLAAYDRQHVNRR